MCIRDRHEARTHSTSSFFVSLSKEVETTYEELRTRKIETGKAIEKLLNFSERIAEWKREEKEIGKDKYPLYEALKTVLPDMEKQKTIDFINSLSSRLEKQGLLFEGWQQQRDVRRKVKAETRLLLLSEYKDYRSKIDELTERIFGALEGMR